jgi:putative ABC transport system permease protein
VLPADGSLTAGALNGRLEAITKQPLPENGASITLEARPVSSIVVDDLQKRFEGFQSGVALHASIGDIVLSLAFLVLSIGCVNFVNLMTARSMSRSREIGVRKSVGATRYRIVSQELFQTALVVLTGIALALLLMTAVEHVTENQWGRLVGVPWTRPAFWALLVGMLVSVTLAAGVYPAAVLARIHPVTALRLGTMKTGPRFLRTTLVVVQVGAAVFLTIVVLVAAAQAATLRKAVIGRFTDPVALVIWPQGLIQKLSFDVLTAELERGPGIKGVALTAIYPFQGNSGGGRRLSRSPIEMTAPPTYEAKFVGFDYFSVMQIPLLAGRDYSPDFADDRSPNTREEFAARKTPFHLILDRAATRSLGWQHPAEAVGQLLYTGGPGLQSEVIGVVETVPDSIRERDTDGTIYYLFSQNGPLTPIRIDAAHIDAAVAHIDKVWKTFAPDVPINRVFLDTVFDNTFRIFTLAGRLLVALGAFAVTIAAIGLFGMAAYVTRRRTREIGLRKSQGAIAPQILRMLLWDFTKPVLLGNMIAWPFALIAARTYVGFFSESMPITPTPFVLALIGSLFVAWLAVGGFVWRAARVNPTVALREE